MFSSRPQNISSKPTSTVHLRRSRSSLRFETGWTLPFTSHKFAQSGCSWTSYLKQTCKCSTLNLEKLGDLCLSRSLAKWDLVSCTCSSKGCVLPLSASTLLCPLVSLLVRCMYNTSDIRRVEQCRECALLVSCFWFPVIKCLISCHLFLRADQPV